MNVIDEIRNRLDLYFTETGENTISKMQLDVILTLIRVELHDENSKKLSKRINRLKNIVDIMNQNGMMEERNIENRFLNLNIKS